MHTFHQPHVPHCCVYEDIMLGCHHMLWHIGCIIHQLLLGSPCYWSPRTLMFWFFKHMMVATEINTLLYKQYGRYQEIYSTFCVHCMHHNDVIKWKHFPHCWPLVQGIQRSPVNSPDRGQWCGALMFSLMYAWTSGIIIIIIITDYSNCRNVHLKLWPMLIQNLYSMIWNYWN